MAARPARGQGRGGVVDNALVREFPPRTLDKIERLLDLLAEPPAFKSNNHDL